MRNKFGLHKLLDSKKYRLLAKTDDKNAPKITKLKEKKTGKKEGKRNDEPKNERKKEYANKIEDLPKNGKKGNSGIKQTKPKNEKDKNSPKNKANQNAQMNKLEESPLQNRMDRNIPTENNNIPSEVPKNDSFFEKHISNRLGFNPQRKSYFFMKKSCDIIRKYLSMPSFILLIVILVVIEGVINTKVLFFIGTNMIVLVYIIMKMVIYPLFWKKKNKGPTL
ncbi:Plasmodium exported protein (Pm-fam-a like), unknown function [Plasmodium ovale wallikeri]|uniref:Uncharacterized protein n=2 Tax=Plasmodium ovale TaxID=36330 RepID=A0A1A9AJB6_PLAOA|nr:Plasmodium exported protein (Pm-fam-a like), unknown function [Plasmodium ovale wallikeri]SBT56275.1 Plasmodium exported protein (Pm-fam-a like), unknown function [Plasmodium ovale wallikeri]SBT74452.1 hypothetical protein, conserved [Plasmodium ovale]